MLLFSLITQGKNYSSDPSMNSKLLACVHKQMFKGMLKAKNCMMHAECLNNTFSNFITACVSICKMTVYSNVGPISVKVK